MSYLGARRVLDLEGTIPPVGGYLFAGHLTDGAPPAAGASTLTLGDLTIAGAILPGRGGTDSPDKPSFVFAGGYGWRTLLPAPGASWSSPTSVRLSTVLGSLAAICGESFDAPTEAKLGPSYGWAAGVRGRAVLADLVARSAISTWRVDPKTGRTTFAPWSTLGPADAHGRIEDRMLAFGGREVALDNAVAAWLPGATVQGVTIARVVFRERAQELRAEVWDA